MSDIDNMPAGAEIDALVAERVMGWVWMRYHDLDYESPDGPLRRTLVDPAEGWLGPPDYVECDLTDPRQHKMEDRYHGPKFSTDWSAAGEVLEKLTDIGYTVSVTGARGMWLVKIRTGQRTLQAFENDAKFAISRAAVKAAEKGGK